MRDLFLPTLDVFAVDLPRESLDGFADSYGRGETDWVGLLGLVYGRDSQLIFWISNFLRRDWPARQSSAHISFFLQGIFVAKNNLTNVEYWNELSQQANYHAEALAKLCGLSSRQLRRHCHQQFGRSTQEWLDQRRLVAAGDLLKRVPLVKAVAFELGYKQTSHFSRQFKKHYGMTASQFVLLNSKPV